MGKVIERTLPAKVVDDRIIHDDKPSTYEAAEAIHGSRLDRRRNYAIIEGEVCEHGSWSSGCSGCGDDREGHYNERGGGCSECGYTGRVRQSMWFPVKDMEADRKWQRDEFGNSARPATSSGPAPASTK
jgi:ribosomal protein L37E